MLVFTLGLVSLVGCQTAPVNTDVIKTSEYNVPDSLLTKHSGALVIDDLENRFYYSGYDFEHWLLGHAYYKLRFVYHPDLTENFISADVRTMQQSWVHADSVSIYVKKEKIVDRWNKGKSTNTSIVDGGSLGSTVYTHEHFNVKLTFENASKIANSKYDDITLRFYGKDGYVDEKIHPESSFEGLKSVIELAKATTLK
ncbi:hypothetical protein GCM10022277_21350 [Litoribacillus peritrichatus]|uniref:Lipoprotein n=1 Tax=Litoribacillus peritrichatus TaxID=718191 RepID=A0ABP7MNF1_9GAMM